MTPIPVVVDCDPGIDDALALLLALASPELDLRAVTTVAGNQTIERTTANALRVLELAGRGDIPVAAGADRPLVRALAASAEVHGESGLDGADLPPPSGTPDPRHAVEVLAGLIGPGVTVVAVGPLTNLALLEALHPGVLRAADRLVLMGGAATGGNVTASAEFNLWADPEAASRVFAAGVPITMVGLDVTHRVLMTAAHGERLAAGGRAGRAAAGMLAFYSRFYRSRYGWDGAAMHDGLAVAAVIEPDVITTRPHAVEISLDAATRGQTVVDVWGVSGRPANVDLAVDVDAARVLELLVDRVAALP